MPQNRMVSIPENLSRSIKTASGTGGERKEPETIILALRLGLEQINGGKAPAYKVSATRGDRLIEIPLSFDRAIASASEKLNGHAEFKTIIFALELGLRQIMTGKISIPVRPQVQTGAIPPRPVESATTAVVKPSSLPLQTTRPKMPAAEIECCETQKPVPADLRHVSVPRDSDVKTSRPSLREILERERAPGLSQVIRRPSRIARPTPAAVIEIPRPEPASVPTIDPVVKAIIKTVVAHVPPKALGAMGIPGVRRPIEMNHEFSCDHVGCANRVMVPKEDYLPLKAALAQASRARPSCKKHGGYRHLLEKPQAVTTA